MAKYVVVGPIKQGGFGLVEKVRNTEGRLLARKTFSPSGEIGPMTAAEHATLRKRFAREVRLQNELRGHSIMPILDFDLGDEPPWFVMPLAERTYAEQIEEDRAAEKISSEPLLDMLNGLEELHRLGYCHRDLKPENVLLHGDNWVLSDFGLVSERRTAATTRLTSTSSVWGTTTHMAPEQVRNLKSATAASDIYSFGCILHDLVDGSYRTPFGEQTTSGKFKHIIEKCTAIDPKKRFKSVAGLRSVLVDLLTESPAIEIGEKTEEWTAALEEIAAWPEKRFEEFASYVETDQDLLRKFDHDVLESLAEKAGLNWTRISLAFCEWVRDGGFDFAYCDVLIGRLLAIYSNKSSSLEVRAAAVTAGAEMASSHNRWRAMDTVMRMAGNDMDDDLAERVAIEIAAADLAADFRTCAARINRRVSGYHPRVARVLEPQTKSGS